MILNGKIYRSINCVNILYCHSHAHINKGTLVDICANGDICGNDVQIMHKTDRSTDVQGINNHHIADVSIFTASAVFCT